MNTISIHIFPYRENLHIKKTVYFFNFRTSSSKYSTSENTGLFAFFSAFKLTCIVFDIS